MRRLPRSWLGAATGLACVLCCAVPFLLAAGVLGGAGWAFLGDPLPGITLVLAAVTGLVWWWTGRRRHGSGCDCGCATS